MGRLIRSLLFDALFYAASSVLIIVFLPLIAFQGASFWIARLWVRIILALLKSIVGLSYQIEGRENLFAGACVIACKHQSAWETLVFHTLLKRPAYVLKKELMRIPVFNLYLKRMGMIYINRKAGPQALKNLVEGARSVMAQGRPLVIFPEGTRGVPGVKGIYQGGIGVLYQQLNVPVIPVALNSGMFWGRRSLVKLPGTITLKFLPPIQPGLKREVFMDTLESSIENACQQLN